MFAKSLGKNRFFLAKMKISDTNLNFGQMTKMDKKRNFGQNTKWTTLVDKTHNFTNTRFLQTWFEQLTFIKIFFHFRII